MVTFPYELNILEGGRKTSNNHTNKQNNNACTTLENSSTEHFAFCDTRIYSDVTFTDEETIQIKSLAFRVKNTVPT